MPDPIVSTLAPVINLLNPADQPGKLRLLAEFVDEGSTFGAEYDAGTAAQQWATAHPGQGRVYTLRCTQAVG